MSLSEIIGTLLIGPLKLLFEVLFSIACDITAHPGIAIPVLSLAMNVLVLPLYRRADAIQEATRDKEAKLKNGIAHIKATFSGDERMMLLQAYYRENNYSPLSVLGGSLSLLLEIPFFMAAYQFLSGVSVFQGLSFGPIADLSVPDGLLRLGSISLNVLPFLMTLINVISSALYLKGFPLKTKIQLYAMALFFLVFLYNSPSALVLYWTLNNVFSLLKTLYYKLPHSKKLLAVLMGVAGVALALFGLSRDRQGEKLLLIGIGLAMQANWVLPLLQKLPVHRCQATPKPNTALFVGGGLFLTVLVGLLIPSTYIGASPQEFIDPSYFYEPIWYVIHTVCLSAGTFLVWMGVFYWLATPGGKVLFSRLIWVACGVMVVNYMFFGTDMGVLSPDLVYNDGFWYYPSQKLWNFALVALLAAALYWISCKVRRGLPVFLILSAVALGCMSISPITLICATTTQTRIQLAGTTEKMPEFTLSQDGKNVIVIMLDRAIGPFVPYLMEENPALKTQFDGFTYYSNTLSYGGFTNFAVPSLFGGYEYTPANSNKRSELSLAQKHDEALKLMPTLFSEAGYQVTMIDPTYAGYKWIPDLSVFKDIPNTQVYTADAKFNAYETRIRGVANKKRNFFFFSLMKTMPVVLQSPIYDQGEYHALPVSSDPNAITTPSTFMNGYNVLLNMAQMTHIEKEGRDTLLLMTSNLTHEPDILQEPDFTPSAAVDNTGFYPDEGKTITDGKNSLLLSDHKTISHYHTNMAALMLLGDWFDYLRQQGVYDNTRIILVADHGRNLGLWDEDYENTETQPMMHNIEFYMPLLMVKDFGSQGFETSSAFMTNADVPLLATDNLIENPTNPFTGKALSNAEKEGTQYVIACHEWDIGVNSGNQYLPTAWGALSGDVADKDSWTFYDTPAVLPPEKPE